MIPPATADAAAPANMFFERTWAYTDAPVANGQASRTWMWGLDAFTGEMKEQYAESPDGQRSVQYFDKSRMEITNPTGDQSSLWYVTNGLLVNELMSGRIQTGDNAYSDHHPADLNVAGDADDSSGVTYRFLSYLTDEVATPKSQVINKILTPGAASNMYLYSDEMAAYGVVAAYNVPETQHSVAGPFWGFMNSWGLVYEDGSYVEAPLFQNPFFATGYPVTEAYWAVIKVAGEYKDVLLQCFERRCLTYTPSNAEGWKVEAGNVGQHYYNWKYGAGTVPPSQQPEPTPPVSEPPPASADLPPVIASQEWQDPQYTISAVVQALTGRPPTDLFFARFLQEDNAIAVQFLFNIAAADVGQWNHDTTGFYGWLEWYIGTWIGIGTREGLLSHIQAQIYSGIYQPESNIYRRLQSMELAFELESPGSGPLAYWALLVNPARWAMHLELPLPLQGGYSSTVYAEFDALIGNYHAQIGTGQYSSFGEYLASQNYMPDLY